MPVHWTKQFVPMKLKSLDIRNFRCFESYHIGFAPKITIAIGRNGAGKSTVIDAVKMALSFIFSNNRKLGTDFLSAGNPSLNVRSFSDSDYRYNEKTGTTTPDASVAGRAIYGKEALEWELYKRSTANAALYSTRYQEAFQKFMHQWKKKGAALPVIACFSDSFPHKSTKQTKYALDSINKERIPLNFGYYQWDLDTACTSIWETRLCNRLALQTPLYTRALRAEAALQELADAHNSDTLFESDEYKRAWEEQERVSEAFNRLHEETDYVQKRLVRFSKSLPQLEDEGYVIDYLVAISTDSGYALNFVFKNGRSKQLKDMAAGYRRLYSIVLDLAYRAYILNGVKESSGIVLIDEIDLHLHPSLEQAVVQCLADVFPEMQFIMTSHSAAVIANLDTSQKVKDDITGETVPASRIVFMQEGQTNAEILPDIYGIDYNAAIRDFMGTASRNEKIRRIGNEYLTYCSLGLKKEAQTVWDEIIGLIGEDNPYIKELQDKAEKYEVH